MTQRLLGKILACVLALALPAGTLFAETHAAMLYAAGNVTLNGAGSDQSSAIFPGDSIQTPANGLVTLTAEGSTVLLGPSSSMVYQGRTVQLGAGTAMVTTDRALKTQVQRYWITPAATGRSSYRVARADGMLMIAALHGPVKISDGNDADSKLVAEGETASMPDTQGGATPGASTGISVNKKILIGVGIGAAAAAALIAIETTKKKSSED